EQDGDSWFITITLHQGLDRYMVPQGAVTVDGISLTIARQKQEHQIGISIIPYTWKLTNLHKRTEGEQVNIEADMNVKAVVSYLERKGY
ncbi:MAG: riboflavin synthase, partial [Candidatus Paceibacteria bacterium]